jgi:hypothetical protein
MVVGLGVGVLFGVDGVMLVFGLVVVGVVVVGYGSRKKKWKRKWFI